MCCTIYRPLIGPQNEEARRFNDFNENEEMDNREDNLMQNLAGFNNDEHNINSSEYSIDSNDSFDMTEMPQYNPPPEIEKLRNFALKISQQNVDEYLSILRPNLLPTLPKSTKIFLRTIDAEYNINEMRDSKRKSWTVRIFWITARFGKLYKS